MGTEPIGVDCDFCGKRAFYSHERGVICMKCSDKADLNADLKRKYGDD